MKLKKITLRFSASLREIKTYILILIIISLIIRLLPYLAPIHSTDITQKQLALQFTDRHNLPLGTILTRDQEHTSIVPLNQISPQFINAIIAAEDSNYYHHGALDIKAIIRATKDYITHQKIISGASTITMQLARMLNNSPRNIQNKLAEIWLSWRLFAGMNKEEILTAYINRLPMGGNIYGVEAAAQIYFSTSASELNLAQSSLLAAIPNNPNYFHPDHHWERLKKRQKYVLSQMVKSGYITQEIADKTYQEEVIFQNRKQGIIAAPHFLFWLAQQNTITENQNHELASTPIQTTIDLNLQQFVETQIQQILESLKENNVNDAAALVIDNHTGEVLAYVGSPDYFNDTKSGRNDGVQGLRQPGSTLKPFVYELGLEKGIIKPNSILADVPTHYAIPGAKLYSPQDYTEKFLGPVRVRIALANSLNIPAVRTLEKIGVDSFLKRLHQLGFENLNQSPEYYGLGLALGSGEVSLWELARAYLTMANLGENTPLITILNNPNITNHKLPISTRQNWQLIINMLSDRYARASAFGVDSVLNLPFPTAVKTGTSSNYRDTWTVGFSTEYTVATWVGNFNGEPMSQVSGVTGAAPLWNRIMLHLHEHQPPEEFSAPAGLIQLPICANTGLKPTPECDSVVQEYFLPTDKIAYENSTDFNLSPVYDQWLVKQQPSKSLTSISNQLRIISPQDGDLFLIYPGGEEQQKLQKLKFQLAKNSHLSVEWWLNGQRLSTQSNNEIFWQLQPGKWRLEAKSGGMRHQINFQVEVVKSQPTTQGFSVVNPNFSQHYDH
ncbi:MAG: penicillin-binding protein 1C [Nostocales cyanobacterium]|nr:MAG: penicillin-binding protein 1C [Nostocales cyanobacterium]TAF19149.1 MAG: penicillin-binding protein 1C [Nostocales cyanobacterium]